MDVLFLDRKIYNETFFWNNSSDMAKPQRLAIQGNWTDDLMVGGARREIVFPKLKEFTWLRGYSYKTIRQIESTCQWVIRWGCEDQRCRFRRYLSKTDKLIFDGPLSAQLTTVSHSAREVGNLQVRKIHDFAPIGVGGSRLHVKGN